MEAIIEAIEGTPWYVFLIFFYVIYIGVKSLHPRTVKFWVILILPTLLTLWSLSIVYHRWDSSALTLSTWVGSLILGTIFGWWILTFYKYHVNRSRGTITLPGSKWTIVLLLAIFGVRYFFAYQYATMSFIPKHFIMIDFAISGFLIGIFIGRALHYWRVYTKI